MGTQAMPESELRDSLHPIDRRMNESSRRDYVMESLEEGRKQFAAIHESLNKLTETVGTMSVKLEENTVLTNRAVELATKTADGTADLVRISEFGTKITKFGRFVASTVAVCTNALSALSKVLVPILILYAIGVTLWHGDKLNWKDILDWVKQIL